MSRLIAAAIQLNSRENKVANLQRAEVLITEAAERGARFVALPEMFNCLGPFPTVMAAAEPIPGPTSSALSDLAARHQIVLLGGSICEKGEDNRYYNTSTLWSADGILLAKYRKVHLFDVDLPGQLTIQESNFVAPGSTAVTAETSVGKIGCAICYDLRFPELFRRLADERAEIIATPSAFTYTTGKDHWEVLVRARAIENQSFVIAPNQCGQHAEDLVTYGNSMIVDPWGRVLVRAGEHEEVIAAELDFVTLYETRQRLPALEHRRL